MRLEAKENNRRAVYKPAEDTFLLAKILAAEQHADSALEVGCGSGFITAMLATKADLVISTDIAISAVRETRNRLKHIGVGNVELLCTNMVSCIRGKFFDLVVCNPPYLPSFDINDATIEGGLGGEEFLERLVQNTTPLLKSDGEIFIVYSDRTKIEKLWTLARQLFLNYEIVGRNRLFYEQIFVAKLRRSN
jgi:HemK-related putative methylase